MRPGALGAHRPTFLAAVARWSDFLVRQPGFRGFTVLAGPGEGEITATNLWADAAAFEGAVSATGLEDAMAGMLPHFAAETAPQFPEVLHHSAP